MKAPCKGCEKRQPYCHSSCNEYAEFRKKMDALRIERRKQQEITNAQHDMAASAIKRTTRGRIKTTQK